MEILCIMFCFCFSIFATTESFERIKINKCVYKKPENSNYINEKSIKKHIAIFEKVNQSVDSFRGTEKKANMLASKDTAKILFDSSNRSTEYDFLTEYKMWKIVIDSEDTPRDIYFNEFCNARAFTNEEKTYLRENKKLAPSFCTISENGAIDRASTFLSSILGVQEKNKFDSVIVSVGGANEQYYILNFNSKIKNDIWDTRTATVEINANTGEITRYESQGRNVDFNYIPKITKNQAWQTFNNECLKIKADVSITKFVLCSTNIRNRWTWSIYGERKDKDLHRSAGLFIDSENGEILRNFLESDY